MLEPCIPEEEGIRLATLRSLNILDTAADERFDRLTRIAQRLFGVPIVAVSLVDENRQWFKSSIGLGAAEIPRNISFCGHAILEDKVFIVEDTLKDLRFADNPVVTGPPNARFYAGKPLKATNGLKMGTFCIIDYEPREFNSNDNKILEDFAAQVENELNYPDLQRMTSKLMKSENKLLETVALLERKEQRERSHNHCLEMVSRARPLPEILQAIVQGMEQQNPELLGCIMMLDKNSNCLQFGAGSLPVQCIDALNGMPLPEALEFCSPQNFSKHNNNPGELTTHPYWSKFSALARQSGLACSWSQPIRNSSGEILGIFSISKRELGYPGDDDLLLIEESANLAAVALERDRIDSFIRSQAYYDSLTGLPNRNLLKDRLEQEIYKARRTNSQVALLFLDLDHFKEVNDKLGHDKGDLLLIEVGCRLLKCTRKIDTVARLGGDEFTVIMGELSDPENAERVANDILETLSLPFQLGDEVAYLSTSIGIAFYPDNGLDMDTLSKNADQAMYDAKSQGRNRFQYFASAMQESALARISMLNDLRNALPENQFEVHYQPVVRLSDSSVEKAEALLRWHHPQRGTVDPREFLPLAEETGLIIEIGEWFFEQVVNQLNLWRTNYHEQFQVTINTSPLQFRDNNGGIQQSLSMLAASGLPNEAMGIEITESLLMEKRTTIHEFLLQVRGFGISITLDDFGAGHTRLSQLQRYQIDCLKIEKSMINDLEKDQKARELFEAIVLMSNKLGINVIAKGVETEQQRQILIDAGCDYAQGYLFSSAVPASSFPFSL